MAAEAPQSSSRAARVISYLFTLRDDLAPVVEGKPDPFADAVRAAFGEAGDVS